MTIDYANRIFEYVRSRLLRLVYLYEILHSLNLRHHNALILRPYILHLSDKMHPLHYSLLSMLTIRVVLLAIH